MPFNAPISTNSSASSLGNMLKDNSSYTFFLIVLIKSGKETCAMLLMLNEFSFVLTSKMRKISQSVFRPYQIEFEHLQYLYEKSDCLNGVINGTF